MNNKGLGSGSLYICIGYKSILMMNNKGLGSGSLYKVQDIKVY